MRDFIIGNIGYAAESFRDVVVIGTDKDHILVEFSIQRKLRVRHDMPVRDELANRASMNAGGEIKHKRRHGDDIRWLVVNGAQHSFA